MENEKRYKIDWIENKLLSKQDGNETKKDHIVLGSVASATERVKHALINSFVIQTILKDNGWTFNYRIHDRDIICNFNQIFQKIKMDNNITEKTNRVKLKDFDAFVQVLELSQQVIAHLNYYQSVLLILQVAVEEVRFKKIIAQINTIIKKVEKTHIALVKMLALKLIEFEDEEIQKKKLLLPEQVKENKIILP